MNATFDQVPDRRHTNSIKWDHYGDRDVLPLWVADMDFAAPAAVINAMHQRVEDGIFGYTHAGDGVTEAFRSHVRKHFDWDIDPDWILWLPGAVPALHAACRLIEPTNKVVTSTPIYPPFRSAPLRMGRGHVEVPLCNQAEGRPERDLDAMEAAFADRGRLLFLCNPHNPTGTVAHQRELEALTERILRHDTLVIADELHADLILEPQRRHVPLASLSPDIARRTITLMAPSKTFNLAGLGLTCAIVPDPELRQQFRALTEWVQPFVTTLAYTAGEAAWRDGQDWLVELRHYLRGNRDLITEQLASLPAIQSYAPEATYLYWLDLRQCGIDQPVAHLEAHGVGLSDGTDFGASGFARLNFACPRATLETALERLHAAFA